MTVSNEVKITCDSMCTNFNIPAYSCLFWVSTPPTRPSLLQQLEHLQWRSYECYDASNHRQVDCLLNLFRLVVHKTSTLLITGPLCGESTDYRQIPSKILAIQYAVTCHDATSSYSWVRRKKPLLKPKLTSSDYNLRIQPYKNSNLRIICVFQYNAPKISPLSSSNFAIC